MATADPFGRLLSKNVLRATKPTGAPTTLTAAQRAAQLARQRQLAMQNESLPGDMSRQAALGPTQLRSRGSVIGGNGQVISNAGAQPIVNPFAEMAGPSVAAGGNPYANYAANQQFMASAQDPAGAAAAAAAGLLGGSPAGGTGAFPVGSGYTSSTKLGQSMLDDALPDQWGDPEGLIDTFYRVMGYGKGSGDYGRQLDDADNLGMMYLALNGADAGRGNAHFVDWAANYLANGRTADGVSISPGEIWRAIVNPEANSPLNYYLNNPSLTPEDQVNNFMSAARYGLEQTLPGPVLNAYLAQIDQMGRDFRSLRNTQTGSASFTDYLGARPGSTPAFF